MGIFGIAKRGFGMLGRKGKVGKTITGGTTGVTGEIIDVLTGAQTAANTNTLYNMMYRSVFYTYTSYLCSCNEIHFKNTLFGDFFVKIEEFYHNLMTFSYGYVFSMTSNQNKTPPLPLKII